MSDQDPGPISELLAIMARLRNPVGGCPWDLEQNFASIAPHTIEEAYEVADAIETGDRQALKGELGDLLFQVVYHAQLAAEEGSFAFADVVRSLNDKMIRRHPHVFGEAQIGSAEAQTEAWETQKATERQAAAEAAGHRISALEGVARNLPAITRGLKLQRRAARVGFDWTSAPPILEKIAEEASEIEKEMAAGSDSERLADEVGDLLFACINLARRLEVEPEGALRHANAKFERRFRRVEALLAERGKEPAGSTLDEMEALWGRAKAEER